MSPTGYLLDTNVISEPRRRRPEPRVTAFLDSLHDEKLFVSVLTVGELRKGAEARRSVDRASARRIESWITGLEQQFADRILPVDLETARLWGRLSATRPRPVIDTLIAATALAHDLVLVTRNTVDMRDTGAVVIDPWLVA